MGDTISKPFNLFKPKTQPLRILCFGDSLTDGYSKLGLLKTPYSKTLKTELEVKFWAGNARRQVEVVTDGQSGDLVTMGTFGRRMRAKCLLFLFVVFVGW
jgi:lysophospholipase L1-like esterase